MLRFIASLKAQYGDKFDRMYRDVVENGKANYEWRESVGRYSQRVADCVLEKIRDGETIHLANPPTIPQLQKLLADAASEIKRPERLRNEKIIELRREQRRKMLSGVHNGVPQGFGDKQDAVEGFHKKIDEKAPGWRFEAEKILAEKGGREYAKFMIEVMQLELPGKLARMLA